MGAHFTRASPDEADITIDWYRTPIDASLAARLLTRSDARGLAQAGGWLAVLFGVGALAVRASLAHDAVSATAWSLAYGCVANFAINGMHELGHETVFKTPALNALFLRIVSFVGWLHPDLFFSSHHRHHRVRFYRAKRLRPPTLTTPTPNPTRAPRP
jgi:fatty acid desaturase